MGFRYLLLKEESALSYIRVDIQKPTINYTLNQKYTQTKRHCPIKRSTYRQVAEDEYIIYDQVLMMSEGCREKYRTI